MQEKCSVCKNQMIMTKTVPEIRNGLARQLTEYKCLSCGHTKVLDRPYEW